MKVFFIRISRKENPSFGLFVGETKESGICFGEYTEIPAAGEFRAYSFESALAAQSFIKTHLPNGVASYQVVRKLPARLAGGPPFFAPFENMVTEPVDHATNCEIVELYPRTPRARQFI